jgi:serine/threonine-protein kinase
MTAVTRAPDLRADRFPREGDLIGGKYRVERLLGIGGMGAVVEAVHLELGQRVAVKVMLPNVAEMGEFPARFLREGRAAAALHSQHVARVFDVGRMIDGAPFLVMELLQGRDLDKIVRAHGPLPLDEAVGYLLQACDAVAEAHMLGIVHRDLKPSNLFLAEQPGGLPMVKVLDFGISKTTKLDAEEGDQQAGLTATDATLGSPQYISPEQLRDSRNVDARTDLWSLGMVLHWLLTGRLAFEASTIGAHLAMVVAEPATPLRLRRSDAPFELEEVILRCLQKRLETRFQNTGQLALALAPFAPAWARQLVPAVVGRVGQAASAAPLPPLEELTVRSSPPSGLPMPSGARAALTDPALASRSALGGFADTHPPGPAGSPPEAVSGAGIQAAWTPPDTRPRHLLGGNRPFFLAGVVAALLLAFTVQRVISDGSPDPASPAASGAAAPPVRGTADPPAPEAAPTTQRGDPAGAREVAVRLALSPGDAEVALDGAPVQDNPILLPRSDRKHTLVVSAPGYVAESHEVSAQADVEITVTLKRQAGARPAPRDAGPTKKKIKGPLETEL